MNYSSSSSSSYYYYLIILYSTDEFEHSNIPSIELRSVTEYENLPTPNLIVRKYDNIYDGKFRSYPVENFQVIAFDARTLHRANAHVGVNPRLSIDIRCAYNLDDVLGELCSHVNQVNLECSCCSNILKLSLKEVFLLSQHERNARYLATEDFLLLYLLYDGLASILKNRGDVPSSTFISETFLVMLNGPKSNRRGFDFGKFNYIQKLHILFVESMRQVKKRQGFFMDVDEDVNEDCPLLINEEKLLGTSLEPVTTYEALYDLVMGEFEEQNSEVKREDDEFDVDTAINYYIGEICHSHFRELTPSRNGKNEESISLDIDGELWEKLLSLDMWEREYDLTYQTVNEFGNESGLSPLQQLDMDCSFACHLILLIFRYGHFRTEDVINRRMESAGGAMRFAQHVHDLCEHFRRLFYKLICRSFNLEMICECLFSMKMLRDILEHENVKGCVSERYHQDLHDQILKMEMKIQPFLAVDSCCASLDALYYSTSKPGYTKNQTQSYIVWHTYYTIGIAFYDHPPEERR